MILLANPIWAEQGKRSCAQLMFYQRLRARPSFYTMRGSLHRLALCVNISETLTPNQLL